MRVSENKVAPVLTPLKENKELFSFEKLERNPPDERKKLEEVRIEASRNKVFNNGHIHKEDE
jgi:hypothetical protein